MPRIPRSAKGLVVIGCVAALVVLGVMQFRGSPPAKQQRRIDYQPRKFIETSGGLALFMHIPPWSSDAALEDYAAAYEEAVPRGLAAMEEHLAVGDQPWPTVLMTKAFLLQARGNTEDAYEVLKDLEAKIKGTPQEAEMLYTIIYYEGVTALRMAENDNCVFCAEESSCIFPISPKAVHANPKGSRLAIEHFRKYLEGFPDDLEVKWLINLAHMTLGEHPAKVDPRHFLNVDRFANSEIDIGQFRDIGRRVGLDRLNQAGGAIFEDFDNDGLFDIVVTSSGPNETMAVFRNKGDGTFEDRTKQAGLAKQTGGLYCVQTDYNNDGHLDIFIPRGAWMPPHLAMRPSLLRNNGDGTFTDVTREAGLLAPVNAISCTWADYDNDGFLDVFLCCQQQRCLLYRNKGDGTFEEVGLRAGLPADLKACHGAAWIDFDNDGFPDLFLNIPDGAAKLFHNNRDGTFTEVTQKMGIEGPLNGFSCWAFDFDNDGWLDIFATSFRRTLGDVVKGVIDQPHQMPTSKLYRNLGGKGFQDVTREFGLDKVYSTMGSNFADIDNDGFLDFYLGTGDPDLAMLVPNRLFKNMAGKRFAEITGSSRTGHLQKGHGVAFADWRRNGYLDLFIELGGAVPADQYHNVLFQNPGHGNNWLSVKFIGQKTNRAAIGARIKVVTAGEQPLTVHRHVSSGSSFGANPLEQHIGVGKAERVALLEIHWPSSGTTQVFKDISVNQGLVITEFAKDFQKRTWKAIPLPK